VTHDAPRATIVLVGHATLANGVLDAAEMILGPQDDVHALGMTPDQDPAELVATIQQVASTSSPGGELLVLADLFGGSPANAVAAAVLRESGAQLVTGLNLPMLLEVLTSGDTSSADLAATATRAGAEGVLDAGRRLRDAASEG
jgi:mannose PTS system EIIA component